MEINKKYVSAHNTSKRVKKIEWIVLHYTANKSSKEGMAVNNAKYFASTDRQASADFIVDDRMVVQYNADIEGRYCWAVGGKKNNYTKGGQFYGKCTNCNSVSIEMCSTMKDGVYSFTDRVIENAAELTRYLMDKYGIDLDHVITHYQVTGKLCPNVEGWNLDGGEDKAFQDFKKSL